MRMRHWTLKTDNRNVPMTSLPAEHLIGLLFRTHCIDKRCYFGAVSQTVLLWQQFLEKTLTLREIQIEKHSDKEIYLVSNPKTTVTWKKSLRVLGGKLPTTAVFQFWKTTVLQSLAPTPIKHTSNKVFRIARNSCVETRATGCWASRSKTGCPWPLSFHAHTICFYFNQIILILF